VIRLHFLWLIVFPIPLCVLRRFELPAPQRVFEHGRDFASPGIVQVPADFYLLAVNAAPIPNETNTIAPSDDRSAAGEIEQFRFSVSLRPGFVASVCTICSLDTVRARSADARDGIHPEKPR
jgi:hypothetical protein